MKPRRLAACRPAWKSCRAPCPSWKRRRDAEPRGEAMAVENTKIAGDFLGWGKGWCYYMLLCVYWTVVIVTFDLCPVMLHLAHANRWFCELQQLDLPRSMVDNHELATQWCSKSLAVNWVCFFQMGRENIIETTNEIYHYCCNYVWGFMQEWAYHSF